MIRFITFLLLACLMGCDSILFESEPGDQPLDIFESIWKDFDVSYPSFTERNIDWDALHDSYKSRITPSTSETKLFTIVSQMLNELRDGHVVLGSTTNWYGYTIGQGKPGNFPGRDYLRKKLQSPVENQAIMGGLLSASIGYIYIESWSGYNSRDQYKYVDKILERFSGIKGLIIDIRNNLGGSDDYANEVMGRFIGVEQIGSFIRCKIGPGHDDLGPLISQRISPRGEKSFLGKPILLLTNRKSFSASDYFAVSMRSLPNVRNVGDTTAGGYSSAVPRELSNGWAYSLPRLILYDVNKRCIDGKGVYPDTPVWTTKTDSIGGRDRILEKAIELIQ